MSDAEMISRIATLEADVASLRERLEHAEAVGGIKRGLEELDRGLGRPAKVVVEELRVKYGLPRT